MGEAEEVRRSLTVMGWRPGLALCLTGGIGPHYQRFLPQEMQAALRPPAGDPLSGALALAWDLSRRLAMDPAS